MAAITVFGFDVPIEALDLEGFRGWVASLDEETARVHFHRGSIHVEKSAQDYETHGPVVQRINEVLAVRAHDLGLGRYFAPPSWFTSARIGLSTEPDGFLVRWESFESGRVRINPERKTEMLGAPDMTLEVVSKTSIRKDTVELVEAYAEAGVEEYWLVDARGEIPILRILACESDGRLVETGGDLEGWTPSPLWRSAFRLTRFVDRAGLPDFRLEVREGPFRSRPPGG